MQDASGEGVDQRVEGRQERPRDIQAHADAHQESAAAPREAQQAGERAAGAAADREDRPQRLPLQSTRSNITSPRCSCGERRQTVAHVLLHCSKYKDLRNRIFANLSGRHSLRTILSTPQLATKAIEYMEQTQILGQVGIRDTQTTPSVGGRL